MFKIRTNLNLYKKLADTNHTNQDVSNLQVEESHGDEDSGLPRQIRKERKIKVVQNKKSQHNLT